MNEVCLMFTNHRNSFNGEVLVMKCDASKVGKMKTTTNYSQVDEVLDSALKTRSYLSKLAQEQKY